MTGDNNDVPALEGGSTSRFLPFGSPDIGQNEIDEVVASLESGWLTTGPKVARFEKMVSSYIGSKYALALNSCTAGLHLSLLSCGIGKGDEVITTPLTFASTANVIEHIGAKPVFVDVELSSMNIDPGEIEKRITKKTKAIIPVHLAGRPCNMKEIMKIARRHKLIIIEDGAHAFGASYYGRKIGTIGDFTSFSFYVTKNLITGEGGIVTTNNKKQADFIKLYSLHGLNRDAWKRHSDKSFPGHYLVRAPGYKYNMMDIQAAIGIHQLKRFEKGQKRREEIWKTYDQAFSDLPVQIPTSDDKNIVHARHLYTLLVDTDRLKVDRDMILQALHAEGIGTGVHFISLHLHPFYKNKYGYRKDDFPNAKHISDRTISIPLSSKLTDSDVKDVISAVRKIAVYYEKNKSKAFNK